MKKKVVNIILIILMIISISGIVLTINYAKNNLENSTIQIDDNFIGKSPKGKMQKDDLSSSDLPDIDSSDKPSGDLPDKDNLDKPSGELPDGDIDSNEMADGGFAGGGDSNLVFNDLELTTMQIAIIGVCSGVFALCLMYLVMSRFNSKKAFIDNNKIIIYVLSCVIITATLTGSSTIIANKYILNSNNNSISDVEYSSTEDLHIDMTNWSYDSDNNVYYQIGLVYVSNPESVEYESLGIYVPGDYMDGEKNGDKYTCTINTTNKVGNYTSSTAPIVMPVNTAGYSAQAAPTSYSYDGLSEYLEAGFIYVYAGCRGRNNGDDYSGGAPWGVTDLKSAIRYLRYNEDSLPGNTDSIFAFGHSGGGAQSSILAASGDSELYTPYLESIGAIMSDDDGNEISDAIAGVMAWCPITSLDYANEAYEWNMGQYMSTGTRASDSWTSALSDDMANAYAAYINALELTDEEGNILKLSESEDGIYISGSYYDYLLKCIEESLTNYLNDNYTSISDMQNYIDSLNDDEEWVTFNSSEKSATISSIEAFVTHCKNASKDVGAFDDLNRSQAENYVFGNDDNDALHWDFVMANLLINYSDKYSSYSDYQDYSSEYSSDIEELDKLGNTIEYRSNMYNPMYYLSSYYDGYKTSTVAKYWRIRTGITQGDTALTVETNLALALYNYDSVESVDFATVWNQGHTTAERTGDSTTNFINYVNECLENE